MLYYFRNISLVYTQYYQILVLTAFDIALDRSEVIYFLECIDQAFN